MLKTLILLMIGTWFGLVFGLSFIEAPLKFQAPGITIPLGLGIGKLVFGTLNKIEIAFNLLLILFAFKNGSFGKTLIIIIGILTSIILIQSLILLPQLDERTVRIINGENIESSYHHIIYIALEFCKLILLPLLFIRFPKHIISKF